MEVLSPGHFEVEMYYACGRSSLGSQVELGFRDRTLESTIDQVHETPLLGASEDRVERQEGYEKRWGIMKLGTMNLSAGRGILDLRLNAVDKDATVEMRLLTFRRIER